MTLGDALPGDRQQRAHVAVQLVLRAVVGVEGDVHRVLLSHDVRELRQRDGTGDHVLAVLAAQELGTAR
ncbi:hypothetical protein SSPO_006190 [Streptomyces antimycoticus]|uniref:Uncharacterized protein n=1 Tax=Streptomyces antimycoticus TaxID=68175 RepID=A0A499UL98_9ACTN|nr:hypothetical protein SSPO_006190 [Streptomyces antimycoticus]